MIYIYDVNVHNIILYNFYIESELNIRGADRGAALGCGEPGGGLPQRGLRHGGTALQMWRSCRRPGRRCRRSVVTKCGY